MVITICKKEFSVILIINVLQIIYGGLGVPFPHFLCFPFPNFASSIDWQSFMYNLKNEAICM